MVHPILYLLVREQMHIFAGGKRSSIDKRPERTRGNQTDRRQIVTR